MVGCNWAATPRLHCVIEARVGRTTKTVRDGQKERKRGGKIASAQNMNLERVHRPRRSLRVDVHDGNKTEIVGITSKRGLKRTKERKAT